MWVRHVQPIAMDKANVFGTNINLHVNAIIIKHQVCK
jgi:hypothetical protein